MKNFTLKVIRESEFVVDLSIHESIPGSYNYKSPKSSKLSIAVRKPTQLYTLHPTPYLFPIYFVY